MMKSVYGAGPLKRRRATKAEMEIPMAGMTMEMEIFSGSDGEFLMRQIMPGMGDADGTVADLREWPMPLYDEYRNALASAIDTRVDLLNEYFASYETLTDKEATALLEKHLAWQKEVLKVRSSYAKKMNKSLSGKTVAKFFQIENKMDIIVEYELAGEIPLIK